jgi:hypothetical protein
MCVVYGFRLAAAYRGSLLVPPPRQAAAAVSVRFVESRHGRRDTIALSLGARPVLLLVYSSSCNVCSDNMPRWLDLVEELRRDGSDVSVSAVDLDGRDSLGNYWPPLRGVKRLTPLDRGAFLRWSGVPGTPTSAVVRAGTIDVVVVGTLGPHRRRYILSRLRT